MINIKFIRDLSIKNKVIVVVLFVVFIVTSVGFAAIATWNIKMYKKDIMTNLVMTSKMIGNYCIPPLYFGDKKQAKETIDRISLIKSVEECLLFDEKGKLFSYYPSTKESNVGEPKSGISEKYENGYFLISEPIFFNGNRVGTISVKANSSGLKQQERKLLGIYTLLEAILMLVSYLLIARVHKLISDPIMNLAKLASAISKTHDFNIKATSQSSKDEVGVLYEQFNNMLAQLLKRESERDEAENKLKESVDHFRYLFEHNPAVLYMYDEETHKFTDANEAFLTTYGYTKEEILTKCLMDIYPERERDEVLARANTMDGLAYVGEWHHLKKDGTMITVDISTHEYFFEGRRMRISTARDITEIKKAAETLSNLNATLEKKVEERTALLEKANKELESFSYSVSHDLRAPLRHINGYLDLIIKRYSGSLDEKGLHYISSVCEAATNMGKLIDDLLNFSRSGRTELKPDNIDMNLIIKDSLSLLEDITAGRKIEWSIAKMPFVYADHAMMRQVWINLISNAVKYSVKREVAIIEIGYKEKEEENIFFIKDNGAGFDMNYSSKLFGVFQRLHSNEEFEGTGIGLANVRQIITRHKGRVWAEGEIDKGAIFYFSLPKYPGD